MSSRSVGVASHWYTSKSLRKLETKKLFHDGWVALCFGQDLPNDGDIHPSRALGLPLLATRDRKTSQINVFHNVCSHRGVELVQTSKSQQTSIRCPYHSWTYKLSGELIATPLVGGQDENGKSINTCPLVNKDELGLKPVRTKLWNDIVFVNVNNKAIDFEEWIKPLEERWAPFMNHQLYYSNHEDSRSVLQPKCNYKLAIENYCEAYHLPWVHPGLNEISNLSDHYDVIIADLCSGQGSKLYDPAVKLPGIDDSLIPKEWKKKSEYVSLYPNILLGCHDDHWIAMLLTNEEVNLTTEDMRIYYFNEKAISPEYEKERIINKEQWTEIFKEDIESVEAMQRGRDAGDNFNGGVFSHAMDQSNLAFHNWVHARLPKITSEDEERVAVGEEYHDLDQKVATTVRTVGKEPEKDKDTEKMRSGFMGAPVKLDPKGDYSLEVKIMLGTIIAVIVSPFLS